MVYQLTRMELPADFVVIGSPPYLGLPHTRLIAARGIRMAEVTARYEQSIHAVAFDEIPPVTAVTYRLTTDVSDFRLIEAPDYPAAFGELERLWPDGPPVSRLAPLLDRRHAVACPGTRCWYADVEGYPRCEPGHCVRVMDGWGAA